MHKKSLKTAKAHIIWSQWLSYSVHNQHTLYRNLSRTLCVSLDQCATSQSAR